jgi:hypothetical protein
LAAITFTSGTSGGELILDASMSFNGTVAGLNTSQGVLDLKDLSFVSGNTVASVSGATTSGATLVVTNGAQTVDIALIGDYIGSTWTTSAAPGGGTLVRDPATPIAATHSAGIA